MEALLGMRPATSAAGPRTSAPAAHAGSSRPPTPSVATTTGRLPTPSARRRPSAVAAAAAPTPARGRPGPLVVIDNYDSFTYNLVQYLGDLGVEVAVFPNDAKTCAEIRAMRPRGVLISPGPGRPEDSGISLEAVRSLGTDTPLFGVCMGHQCIGQAFGGDVIRAPGGVMHGKASPVHHKGVGLMAGMPSPFNAARYHSLVIDAATMPADLEVTAWTEDGTVMAVRHLTFPHIQGVQFHPESIITDGGKQLVANFVAGL